MDFKNYIKNWNSNFTSHVLPPQLITNEMKAHINSCRICRGPITLYTICQDKYLSQLFVRQLRWRTPKLYFNGTCNTFTRKIYKDLPDEYVMKMTHGYGAKGCVPVINKKILNKHTIPSFNYFKKWMDNKYIICEEYLLDKTSVKYPIDYKCYVFNGTIKYICVVERFLKSASLHAIDFKRKYKFVGIRDNSRDIILSNKALYTLKKYCRDLSIFNNLFIRVDFYIIEDEVIFGEFTPNPNNGHHYSREMLSLLDRDIRAMGRGRAIFNNY